MSSYSFMTREWAVDPFIYAQMREVEDKHWWFVARRQILQSILATLELPEEAHILDAGCGTGGNLAMLQTFGVVSAMEVDDDARQLANARQLAHVSPGHLPDGLHFPQQRFDLIVLLDVLEHIEDDVASLAALQAQLTANGRIVLTVPAFQALWGPHDVIHHHKRRYRAAQLQDVARASGLVTEYLSYYNLWLFPIVALVRLMQRFLPAQGSQALKLPADGLNTLLTKLFASERHFIPRRTLPFGVSLVAVLKSAT